MVRLAFTSKPLPASKPLPTNGSQASPGDDARTTTTATTPVNGSPTSGPRVGTTVTTENKRSQQAEQVFCFENDQSQQAGQVLCFDEPDGTYAQRATGCGNMDLEEAMDEATEPTPFCAAAVLLTPRETAFLEEPTSEQLLQVEDIAWDVNLPAHKFPRLWDDGFVIHHSRPTKKQKHGESHGETAASDPTAGPSKWTAQGAVQPFTHDELHGLL